MASFPACDNRIEMRSELQIQASRANGSKSRGPVTEEGKRASSQNALKHGMLAKYVVIHSENEEGFHEVITCLYDELQPQPGVEQDLVDTMAVARWRTTRLWIIEKSAMETQMSRENDQAHAAQYTPPVLAGMAFRSLADNSRTLDLINRYESRYDRQYLRSHKRLMDMRKLAGPCDSIPPNEPKPDEPGPAATSRGTGPADSSRGSSTPEADSSPIAVPAAPSDDAGGDGRQPAVTTPSVSAGNSASDATNSAKRTQADAPDVSGPAATSRGKSPVTRIKNNSKRRRLKKLARKSLRRGPLFPTR